jgi:hypothetical protein
MSRKKSDISKAADQSGTTQFKEASWKKVYTQRLKAYQIWSGRT